MPRAACLSLFRARALVKEEKKMKKVNKKIKERAEPPYEREKTLAACHLKEKRRPPCVFLFQVALLFLLSFIFQAAHELTVN